MKWLIAEKRAPSKSRIVMCAIAIVTVISLIGIGWNHRHTLFMKAPQNKAFYFWKTKWRATPGLTAELEQSGVSRLYMRFFDVGWSAADKQANPVSPIDFADSVPRGPEIVPVVYVTKSVFINIAYAEVEPLANNVWNKVHSMALAQRIDVKELQIDCDWSDSSRKNYFHFVDLLRRQLNKEKINVSSTIRLHQIKYADRTGVPPVNSGMLMFYNFGQIKADGKSNSIFNAKEAKRYASYISTYSLPLGISLPMFSWIVHVRDSKVQGLIEGIDPFELETQTGFKKVNSSQFLASDSFFFHGRYFIAGDKLNIESTDLASTVQAANLAI
jgi:hypothetical protein